MIPNSSDHNPLVASYRKSTIIVRHMMVNDILVHKIIMLTRYSQDFVYLHIDLNTKFHFTGLFFPWHRWYVHTYEKALSERCGFRGMIPCWDWTKGQFMSLTHPSQWPPYPFHAYTDVADGMQNMTILSDDPINGLGS